MADGPITFYDHRNRPIRRRDLRREVAGPSVTGVRSILSTHPASNLTPERLAALLRDSIVPGGADRYLELAEEMEERDLHYLGVLQTRKRQVAQIPVIIEPASDGAEDKADAELAQEFFKRDTIETELFDLLDALGKGFSVSEIVWDTSEGQWMPERLVWRLPQWFDFDQDTGTVLQRRRDSGGQWVDLEPYKFVCHFSHAKSGLPIRGGLARIAGWGWLFKALGLRDWIRFIEAYGLPIRLGKYPPNSTPADIDTLVRAVRNVAGDAAAVVPEGMLIEFVTDTQVQGRSDVHRDLVNYIDQQMSIAVLGQTLTTQEGESGSYSLGQVHNLVRRDIEDSDARLLAATLRRDLVVPIVRLNRGERKAYPMVKIEREDPADIKMLADVLTKLVPLGLKVRVADVRTLLDFDEPGDEDEVLQTGGGAGGDPPEPDGDDPADIARMALALALAQARRPAAVDDAIDMAVARATSDWRPLLDPAIEPILAAAQDNLGGGGSLDGFRERLPALFDRMDDAAVLRLLHHLSFSAELSGQAIPDDGDAGA